MSDVKNHEADEIVEHDWVDLEEVGVPFSAVLIMIAVAFLASFIIKGFTSSKANDVRITGCYIQGYTCQAFSRDEITLTHRDGGSATVKVEFGE